MPRSLNLRSGTAVTLFISCILIIIYFYYYYYLFGIKTHTEYKHIKNKTKARDICLELKKFTLKL